MKLPMYSVVVLFIVGNVLHGLVNEKMRNL